MGSSLSEISKLKIKLTMNEQKIKQAYELAVERYASLGVDVEKAMELLGQVSLSMHCWQADDVTGFESAGSLS